MEGIKKNTGAFFDKNNLREIISVLKKLANRIYALHSRSKEDFAIINQHLKNCHKILKNINQFIPQVKEKTAECSTWFAKIITDLQYQDIINQKIDHIQRTLQELIDELELLDQNFEQTHIHIRAKAYLRSRDIIGLQAAQLIYANKQYRSSLDNIVKNFKKVNEIIETIVPILKINTEISSKISELINNSDLDFLNYVFFDSTCEAFIDGINDINMKLNADFDNNETISKEENLKQLKEKYTMDSEHLIHELILKSEEGNMYLFDNEDGIINLNEKKKDNDENLELF